MHIIAFALVGTLVSAPVMAQSYYDWESGNSYNVQRGLGSTTVYGNNLRTGSNWRIQQMDNGSYSGTDSRGNFFSGNHNSGFYMNSDGTTCIGTGALRTCNLVWPWRDCEGFFSCSA
jgi:hypothetical protein